MKLSIWVCSLFMIGAMVAMGEAGAPVVTDAGTGKDAKESICESGRCAVPKEGAQVVAAAHPVGTVTVEGLAAILRAKVPVLIFDARTGKWDDGRRIPGAQTLHAGSTPDEVKTAIPDRSALIVTYCGGPKCPASHQLAERLIREGFKNIVELPEGIEGWVKAGHPVDKVR